MRSGVPSGIHLHGLLRIQGVEELLLCLVIRGRSVECFELLEDVVVGRLPLLIDDSVALLAHVVQECVDTASPFDSCELAKIPRV